MQEKENKNQNILIRVSPTEKKKIEEKAEQVHKTVAGYLLDLTESKRVILIFAPRKFLARAD